MQKLLLFLKFEEMLSRCWTESPGVPPSGVSVAAGSCGSGQEFGTRDAIRVWQAWTKYGRLQALADGAEVVSIHAGL